jgi:hypothetical protein
VVLVTAVPGIIGLFVSPLAGAILILVSVVLSLIAVFVVPARRERVTERQDGL